MICAGRLGPTHSFVMVCQFWQYYVCYTTYMKKKNALSNFQVECKFKRHYHGIDQSYIASILVTSIAYLHEKYGNFCAPVGSSTFEVCSCEELECSQLTVPPVIVKY